MSHKNQRLTKEQTISKIRSTNPLSIESISIDRNEPEAVKRRKVKEFMERLQSSVIDLRDVHLFAVVEK